MLAGNLDGALHSGGKSVRCNGLGARATTVDAGAHTNTDPGANVTGALAASAPSTTSSIPCGTRASGPWCTGYSRPFWWALPARPGALRERWESVSARAIAGAGGDAMWPCPTRCSANWKAPWKRTNSIMPPARMGKPKAGKKAPGTPRAWALQETRAGPGILRQRPTGDYRLG
jgi:hypothetical protein